MTYTNTTGRRMTRRSWLTREQRKERLHHALKANYDRYPDPPLRWHVRYMTVDGQCGFLAENGLFEPDVRHYLYPHANILRPDEVVSWLIDRQLNYPHMGQSWLYRPGEHLSPAA